jgi:DNA-binding GntR family transcriptional regulator
VKARTLAHDPNLDDSLADQVFSSLCEAILKGKMVPEEKLVEQRLAEAAQVSRTPVREALKRLLAVGLAIQRGRSLIVAPLTINDILELCAIREALEALAIRLATVHRSTVELAILRDLVETAHALIGAGRDPELLALNHQFHETLWTASRNRLLAAELYRLRDRIETIQDPSFVSHELNKASASEHKRLVDALEAGDADAAESLIVHHLQTVTAGRVQALQRLIGTTSSIRSDNRRERVVRRGGSAPGTSSNHR